MGRSTALILAVAIAAGVSVSAKAADLLPPPPPIEAPPPPDFGGWYLRGDTGIGINQIDSLRSTFDDPRVYASAPGFDQYSIGDSALIGLGVGYQFNSWLRFDLTGEYRFASNYRATQSYTDYWSAQNFVPSPCGGPIGATPRCYDLYQAQVRSAVFLANAYFDLGTWYGITPFVGGGLGLANHWFQHFNDWGPATGGFGMARDTEQTNFAWAVMAGVAYHVTPNLKMELGYRYLDMGKITTQPIICSPGVSPCERQSFNLASHDIRLGFRYALGGFGPPPIMAPPPGPLVRKF